MTKAQRSGSATYRAVATDQTDRLRRLMHVPSIPITKLVDVGRTNQSLLVGRAVLSATGSADERA